MNKRNLIPRIIASPFLLFVILISTIYKSFKIWVFFIKHGGEIITYEKGEPTRLSNIYELLKEKLLKYKHKVHYKE
jgi:hypothetical protein